MSLREQHPQQVPYMLFADEKGQIFDHPEFLCVGRSSKDTVQLNAEDFIPLPEGSDIFFLPERIALGFNPKSKKVEVLNTEFAVAAFVSPAHTQLYLSAYTKDKKRKSKLPLYAYAAVGWLDDKFWVTATRVDPDIRQDYNQFDQDIVEKNFHSLKKKFSKNRLLKHIGYCATVYFCPAARNFFQYRWEAPLPAAPTCNAQCVGCISWQEKSTGVTAPQNRIEFVPTPEEIAEIAIFHLEHAPKPIVSFGQGCEGEPLMVWETLLDAIKLIRKKTSKGIINLNSNASLPNAIDKLCANGLDSLRISMNSAQKDIYTSYYRPSTYQFEDILESCKIARKHNAWVSLNYFVFPGFNDTDAEEKALVNFIEEGNPNMIQWRNFNIDPEWYISLFDTTHKAMGVKKYMERIIKRFPHLYHGYFNPGEEIIQLHQSR